jgi:ribosomal protein L16/L10AE
LGFFKREEITKDALEKAKFVVEKILKEKYGIKI